MPAFSEARRRVPGGRVRYDPVHAAWLDEWGYLALDPPVEHQGREVFFRSARRENARIAHGPDGRVLFEKRLGDLGASDLWRNFFSSGRGESLLFREWRVLRHALAMGLRVPEPWAAGEALSGGVPREGFLLVEELPGTALEDLIREDPDPGRKQARALARAVGRGIAELHASGIAFPALFAKHVWIDRGPDGLEVGFIDLAEGALRRPSKRDRARDLGALAATLPRFPVSRTLRLVALDAYFDASPDLKWTRREAWNAIGHHARRLGRKRRYRRYLSTAPVAPEVEEHLDLDTIVVPAERAVLDAHGGLGNLHHLEMPGWTIDRGRGVLRTDRAHALRWWSIARLLRLFDIPAPIPVALRLDGDHAALLARISGTGFRPLASQTVAHAPRDAEERIRKLIRGLLAAGLVPGEGFAEHLTIDSRRRIGLDPQTPLSQPSEPGREDVAQACRILRATIDALPLDAAARERLHRELREAAPTLLGPR